MTTNNDEWLNRLIFFVREAATNGHAGLRQKDVKKKAREVFALIPADFLDNTDIEPLHAPTINDDPVMVLDLNTRVYNNIVREGINTVGELRQH